ncbi:MAG: hypothetical protein COC22_00400 [Flavobacteriaceae bacterium]|nr:MAG: hypothetical protein COC22_00400 [Flavobacteriaceae bacterium]
MLVVCHDAGGAEVVSAWVRRNPDYQYRFILDGPAVKIFKGKITGLEIADCSDLAQLIDQSAMVLTGTSWASDLEKKAIKYSKERQVNVTSFLDHWCNFPDRFQYDGVLVLPDEIWVGDTYAQRIAAEQFPDIPVRLIENPYMMDIRAEIDQCGGKQVNGNSCCNILYVCEPVSVHALKESGRVDAVGYTEFEAMDLFISHLQRLDHSDREIRVRIRSHPSEPMDKYADYAKMYSEGLEITVGKESSLIADCAWSDMVVGMNSMALIIALEVRRKVFCCIPGHSKPTGLPHEGIHNFLELEKI